MNRIAEFEAAYAQLRAVAETEMNRAVVIDDMSVAWPLMLACGYVLGALRGERERVNALDGAPQAKPKALAVGGNN